MKPSPYLVRVLEQAVTDNLNHLSHVERQIANDPQQPEMHAVREQVQNDLTLKRLQLAEARLGILVWPMQEAMS